MEFNWGKWSGDDVRDLEEPLLGVVTRTGKIDFFCDQTCGLNIYTLQGVFQSFAKLIGHPYSKSPEDTQSIVTSTDATDDTFTADTYLLRQIFEKSQATELEHKVRLVDVMPVIRDSSLELRDACSAGIGSAKAVIENINMKRYARKGAEDSEQRVEELEINIKNLNDALDRFKDEKHEQLIEPFQALLQGCQTKRDVYSIPLRSLYISFVYGVNLIILTDGILALMEVVKNTALERTRNRLWAPSKLRAIGKVLLSRGGASDNVMGEDEVQEKEEEAQRDCRAYSKHSSTFSVSFI